MGTVTPRSFYGQDVASWLLAEGLWGEGGSLASGKGTLGSVRIGRLRWGRQGPAPRSSVQDGLAISVMVDRHGSHVGNPFTGAPTAQLCRAYDELLRNVLSARLLVDDCLHDFEGLRRGPPPGAALITPHEKQLLLEIAERHGVKIHPQRVRPLDVRAWLVYHASLLVQGRSLCLFCWCAHGD